MEIKNLIDLRLDSALRKLRDYIAIFPVHYCPYDVLTINASCDDNDGSEIVTIHFNNYDWYDDRFQKAKFQMLGRQFSDLIVYDANITCERKISINFYVREVRDYAYYHKHSHSKKEVDKSICMDIDKVIYHDPATIVYWKDGTKTVVKAQNGETYDWEKGLALCFMKKVLGNEGNYNNEFRKNAFKEE